MKIADFTSKKSSLAQGYRTCSGCPITTIVRHVLRATDDPVVVAVATGCLEVTTTIFPDTAWEVPLVHSLLENAAATISGIESAYKTLRRKNKLPDDQPIKFVVFAGDGATYDAGLQFLSAAIERGHDFVYVCYNNEGYMNTGGQKSGATPEGAITTTTPAGRKHHRKDLTKIIAAHDIPYAAQAAVWHWQDLYSKAQKAFAMQGPAFLNVFSPCVPGWKIDTDKAIELSRLAVETGYWELYEVEKGEKKITVPVEKPKPIEEFKKLQGRFKNK
ncbi:thiamine pyrophosphate-dependent enzyme [Patescibacteria group bacterium]